MSIFPPWQPSRWHAVDDRLRGGSSTSHLDHVHNRSAAASDQVTRPNDVAAVRFWGHLDTQTLGGAGFASRNTAFTPRPLSLSRVTYAGLTVRLRPDALLSVHDDTPDTLTLVLKNAPSGPPRDHGPRPAQVTYEADMRIPLDGGAISRRLAWSDFKAVYRGRTVPKDDERYRPLDTEAVYELSLMCRSGFGKQEGDFGVEVLEISGWEREERHVRDTNGDDLPSTQADGCWRGIKRWLGLTRIELDENVTEKA